LVLCKFPSHRRFYLSLISNEQILKLTIIFVCPGEEKEAWKGWKDGRSGSCSVCEFMITAVRIVSHTCGSYLEFMSLRMARGNAPERSLHKLVPLTSYRHMALWNVISNHLGVRMMLQRCSWVLICLYPHHEFIQLIVYFFAKVDTYFRG
jgi:hypothetical protein